MKTQFEVNGWFKSTEEDHYKDGCLLNTGASFSGTERWIANTIPELIKKLRDFVGVPDEYEIELDSCGEEGRVDISVLETADSYTASKCQIEQWKAGDFRLWYSCYSFHIEEVTHKTVSLIEDWNNGK